MPFRTGVRKLTRLHGRDRLQNSLSVAPYYQWLSDHELLLLRVRESKGGGGGPDGSFAFGEGFYLAVLDIRTGKERPFQAFNEIFFGSSRRSIGYWILSPDRNMLFWPERTKPRPIWHAATLDGAQSHFWAQPNGDGVGSETPYYAWMPDSRGWVALLRRAEERLDLAIGSFDRHGVDRLIEYFHRGPGFGFPGLAVLGVTEKCEGIAALWGGLDSSVRLFRFDVRADNPTPDGFVIHPPNGTNALQIALSPSGDHLGWVLHAGTNRRLDEFWVSRLDGTDMRKVGEVSYKAFFPMEDEHHPEGLAWTPDGRRLSFIYKGSLCTVGTD